MSKSNAKYLIKHHQTYYFKKRLPQKLVDMDLPEFNGKQIYVKSLRTDSLSEALRLRELELSRLERLMRGDTVSLREQARKRLEALYGRPNPAEPLSLHSEVDIEQEIDKIVTSFESD